MIIKERIQRLPLQAGDEVVGVTAWRDMIFIVTRQGAFFQLTPEERL